METSYPRQEKPLFIRFPTVTKLTYPFQNTNQGGQPHKTSYRSNSTIREHIKMTLLSKNESFKIVQLPPKHQIMNICRMTMGEKQERPSDSFPKKTLFSVKKRDQNDESSPSEKIRKSNSLKNFPKLNSFPPVPIDFNEIYPHIARLFTLSFGIRIEQDSIPRTRKARVEEGNNGYLVRQIIKKRTWWTIVSDDSKIKQSQQTLNLIWSQHSLNSKLQQQLTENNLNCLQQSIQRQEDPKVTFPKYFERILSQLPKIKQLFVSEETKTGKIKDLILNVGLKQMMTLRNDNLTLNNHLLQHRELTDKKMLYKNMTRYYIDKGQNPHEKIPKSYHLTCFEWQTAVQAVLKEEGEWILKPGENSNQGKGITIFRSSKEAADYILTHPPTQEKHSLLLQTYIHPSLYNLRKYDLRCFLLALHIGSSIQFFWYEEGYIRTSSRRFSMKTTARGIHLTNDSVQKYLKHYGEHEPNNKLSFQDLDKYLLNNEPFSLFKDILPKIKTIAGQICEAVADKMRENPDIAFELMGLDFLIDEKGQPWLLQVNTNPSLQANCNLLSRIIPEVLENTMRLLDIFFGGKKVYEYGQHFMLNNKFSLLYGLS